MSNTVHIMHKMEILLLTYFSSSFPLYSSFLFTPLFQCPFKTQRMSLVLSLYINSIQPTSSLYDSTRIPYSFPRTYCCYQKEKWTKSVYLPRSNVLSELGEHWLDKTFHFSFQYSVFKSVNSVNQKDRH